MKLLALCESSFVRKTFGGILSRQAAFEKRLAVLGEKSLKQNKKKIGKLGQAYFKKNVRRAKRDYWHSVVESVNSRTPTARLQGVREKIFQGVQSSILGPQILLGPQALSGGPCR